MKIQLFMMRFVLLLCSFFIFREGMCYHVLKKCMGARFVVLIDEDDKIKAKGADAAFKEAERLNMVLSDYESSSELVRFSGKLPNGRKVHAVPGSFRGFEPQPRFGERNGRIFYATIGPLSRLWRIARFQEKMPPEIKLSSALNRIGYRKMGLSQDDRSGTLRTPGMVLDLGGIAKSYAADRMVETLKGKGLQEQMLDRCRRRPGVRRPAPRRAGWRVEIGGLRHPDSAGFTFVKPRGCHFRGYRTVRGVEGKRYSHLIDPGTGLGLTTQCQVTVLASTGMEADSFASVFPVMGLSKAQEYLDKKTGITVYYLQKKGSVTTFSLLGRKR